MGSMAEDSATTSPSLEWSDLTAGSQAPAQSKAAASDQATVIQVALAEFNKLRDEISARSGAAWTLLGLNATVSSAVAGFVLARQANPLLVLLLPLLTPSLGLLFIDHATNIKNIGKYIDSVLKPMLRDAAGEQRLLSYEELVDDYEGQPVRRLLPFGIPLVLLFNVVPVASLLFTVAILSSPWAWTLWGIGVLMTLVQVAFWIAFLAPPLRSAVEKGNS